MSTLDKLADEKWRIFVDECEPNEPYIGYPDPDNRGRVVGPLIKVMVGDIEENEDGDEVLIIDGDEGRNLLAVACLPQFAGLLRWLESEYQKRDVSNSDDTKRFFAQMKARINWIRDSIDKRDMDIGPTDGSMGIGFEHYRSR